MPRVIWLCYQRLLKTYRRCIPGLEAFTYKPEASSSPIADLEFPFYLKCSSLYSALGAIWLMREE